MSVVRQLLARLRGDRKPQEPAARTPAVPAPHPKAGGVIRAISRTRIRITKECNTGLHYECGRCGCGCHKPLTNRRT